MTGLESAPQGLGRAWHVVVLTDAHESLELVMKGLVELAKTFGVLAVLGRTIRAVLERFRGRLLGDVDAAGRRDLALELPHHPHALLEAQLALEPGVGPETKQLPLPKNSGYAAIGLGNNNPAGRHG